MKKKLLIINQLQFGYHSDTYYYCKYLGDTFNITYICWDHHNTKITLEGVKVIYISRAGNLVIRNSRFLLRIFDELKNNYDFHLIKYFRGCSLLRMLSGKKNFLLDIRSSSIRNQKASRMVNNFFMVMETKAFRHISIISKSLARKLRFHPKSYTILPLGAEVFSYRQKLFNSMELLYVGTLYKRNIEETIQGFSKFYHEYKDIIQIRYTIIGNGLTTEKEGLRKIAQAEKVDTVVELVGQIPHDKIKPFFELNNIGVSYIPKTEYFEVQPATKTFEYLLSGMPVIATDTLENKQVIHSKNGVLINDTAQDFYEGLVQIYTTKKQFDSDTIRSDSNQYRWCKIVNDLNTLLQSLIKIETTV